MRELLDQLGLKAPAAHVPLGSMEKELDSVIDAAGIIGHEFIVVPWLSPWDRRNLRKYEQHAGAFNEFGRRCRDAGLRFAYHNHDFEFQPMGGKVPYDLLLEQTDPELVSMELDLYWAHREGVSALDYFERFPGRFSLCHVKDADAAGEIANPGGGVIDFPAVLPRGIEQGMAYLFVEHDKPDDAFLTAKEGLAYLRSL